MKERITWQDWDDVRTDQSNSVAKSMVDFRSTTGAVVRGKLQSACVCGPSGIGKSKAIADAVGPVGRRAIYCTLFKTKKVIEALSAAARNGSPVVFDDADDMFRNRDMLTALKAATQPNPKERVYDGTSVNARIFISTGADLTDHANWPKAHRQFHDLMIGRLGPITIPDANHPDLWEYSVSIAITTDLLRNTRAGDGIPIAIQNAALEFFTINIRRLRSLTPGSLKSIAETMHQLRGDTILADRLKCLLGPCRQHDLPIPLIPTMQHHTPTPASASASAGKAEAEADAIEAQSPTPVAAS